MATEEQDTTIYRVVMNHEEQYSIWPDYKENALGWQDAGKVGTKDECLAYIKMVWTDMRPLSLRKKVDEQVRTETATDAEQTSIDLDTTSRRDEPSIVDRLSQGSHPVEVSLRPESDLEIFREAIERGYVHVRFTETKGSTELGLRLENNPISEYEASFDSKSGKIQLVGGLTLDYVKVRCIADIELETLTGHARLRRVNA